MKNWFVFVVVFLSLTSCASRKLPVQMSEAEIFDRISKIEPKAVPGNLYQEYSAYEGRLRYKFERVGENNVVYGWYTCSGCKTWKRVKILAIFDGEFLNVTYGRHEEFFTQSPKNVPNYPKNPNWDLGSILKFDIRDNKLVETKQIRKCPFSETAIREWLREVGFTDGYYDCRKPGKTLEENEFIAASTQTVLNKPNRVEQASVERVAEPPDELSSKPATDPKPAVALVDLPPEIERDRLMVQIADLFEAGNAAGALPLFDRLNSLPVPIDPAADFYWAQSLLANGDRQGAAIKLGRFLQTIDSSSPFYAPALRLMTRIEG